MTTAARIMNAPPITGNIQVPLEPIWGQIDAAAVHHGEGCQRIHRTLVLVYIYSVSMRSTDFKNHSHQQKLESSTDITSEVYELAKHLFAELWDGHTPLRLIGLGLSDITHDDGVQMSLFEDTKKDRARKIDQAMDAIRSKYDSSTILRGTVKEEAPKVGKKYTAHLDRMHEKE